MENKKIPCTDISPDLLLGEISNTPFVNKNVGPRNMFYYAQAYYMIHKGGLLDILMENDDPMDMLKMSENPMRTLVSGVNNSSITLTKELYDYAANHEKSHCLARPENETQPCRFIHDDIPYEKIAQDQRALGCCHNKCWDHYLIL